MFLPTPGLHELLIWIHLKLFQALWHRIITCCSCLIRASIDNCFDLSQVYCAHWRAHARCATIRWSRQCKTSPGFTHSLRLSGIAATGAFQMSVLERIDWRVSSLAYFPSYSWFNLTQPASCLSLLLLSVYLFYYFPRWSPVCNRPAPCALWNNLWLMSIRPKL